MRMSIKTIKCKKDLIEFLHELQVDYETDGENWNNQTIGAYLEAINAWLNDSSDTIEDNDSWRYIATLMLAGKMYE